jgi:hypothetical protein
MNCSTRNSHYIIIICSFLILINPILFSNYSAKAQQENLDVLTTGRRSPNVWLKWTDKEHFLIRHLIQEAMGQLEERDIEIAKLNSSSDWRNRQKYVRTTLIDILGPLPDKTPLNAQVTKRIQKSGFTVEHIVYESQPGFYVVSSLYLPEASKTEKTPAIIYLSGHTEEGYRSVTYQHKILNLVKKGFIVFAIDPYGQGERKHYTGSEAETLGITSASREHTYPGAQVFITGSSPAKYMIWDGIRAVDYLLTRDEVDPDRIGMTGRSGGGTQTSYIASIDNRVYAAAPEAFITSKRYLLQSIGAQDAEQNLFHGVYRKIDHSDYLIARAPLPTLMIGTTRDFISIQGFLETAEKVTGVYNTLGMDENFDVAVDEGRHGTTRKNREAMYAFFQKHLDHHGDHSDVDISQILTKEEMQVTESGQVLSSFGGETVFSLNRREALKLVEQITASREDLSTHLPSTLENARKLSGFRKPTKVKSPVYTGYYPRDGYTIEKFFIQGEGDYVVPYLLFVPDVPNNKALIYLNPDGKSIEAGQDGMIEPIVKKGFTVLAPDLLGHGEIALSDTFRGGGAFIGNVSYHVWHLSVLTGRSIAGIQAGDVVRLTQLLKNSYNMSEVYAVAERELSPVLLHAATFEPAISHVALLKPYSSYRAIVNTQYYRPDFLYSTVPGALTAYDLPDLAAAIAPRPLAILNVTDGAGRKMGGKNILQDYEGIQEDLKVIRQSFQIHNVPEKLVIDNIEDMYGYIYKWIDK